MRLIKLSLCAFGPYAKEQVIDFQKISDKKLFLITGPTGAGKTAIFDAISYALFGQSSGDDRDGDSLISHFSTVDKETYVLLEFQIRDDHYSIRRSPKQIRRKVKGEGTTTKSVDAEFIINHNKVYHGVIEVNQKIQEVLGINYHQFKQIVMLPQGEFRKLLEASSQDREMIFRKIFRTEGFKAVQERLKIKTNQLKSQIKNTYDILDNNVDKLYHGEDLELESLVNAPDKDYLQIILLTQKFNEERDDKLKELAHIINNSDKIILDFEKKINEGREINKKLRQKDELIKSRITLLNTKDEIDELNVKLKKAKEAEGVHRIELEINKLAKTIQNLTNTITSSRKEKEMANLDLIEMEKDFLKAKISDDHIKEDEKKIYQLNQQLNKYKEYNELKSGVTLLEKEVKKQTNLLNIEKEKQDKYLLEEKNYQDKLKEIQNLSNELANLKLLRHKKETKQKELKVIINTIENVITTNEKHQKIAKEYQKADEIYKKVKMSYDEQEGLFLASQAGIIASRLEENKACPVCGSCEHPKKAVLVNKVLTDRELKDMKEDVSTLEKQVNDLYVEVYNLNQSLMTTKNTLHELETDEFENMEKTLIHYRQYEMQIQKELNQLVVKINSMNEKINKKESYEHKINEYNELFKIAKDNVVKITDVKSKISQDYQVKLTFVKNAESEYINEYPSEIEINKAIKKLSEKIAKIEKEYLNIQKKVNDKKDRILVLDTRIINNEEIIVENEKLYEDKLKELDAQLKEYQFTNIEAYQAYLFSHETLDNFLERIKAYDEELNYITKTLAFLDKELSGKELVNLEILTNKQQEEKMINEKRRQNEKTSHALLQNNVGVLSELKRLYKKVKDNVDEYNILSDISKVANGDNGERLTFERYVLAAYFDEIIKAANMRLANMTNNRYILCRKEEKGKGSAQQGLDLEVIDAYTGKMRTVKTLSGGEAFIASLALALGLADVVQSYSGGIELDTIFIDEGFGTLDPEALEHAVETLVGIQKKGRLVGIISHVEELKERIDVKLTVIPSKEGSRATFTL